LPRKGGMDEKGFDSADLEDDNNDEPNPEHHVLAKGSRDKRPGRGSRPGM
jgi:hypothetical protein